jgi:hypothetical protein
MAWSYRLELARRGWINVARAGGLCLHQIAISALFMESQHNQEGSSPARDVANMSPKFSNPNRRFHPASGTGRTVGLILTIAVLCAVVAVIKDCHGGGHMLAPATENRGSVVITDLRATLIYV